MTLCKDKHKKLYLSILRHRCDTSKHKHKHRYKYKHKYEREHGCKHEYAHILYVNMHIELANKNKYNINMATHTRCGK